MWNDLAPRPAALQELAFALEELAEALASTRRVLLDRAMAARVGWEGATRRWFEAELAAVDAALNRSAVECRQAADDLRWGATAGRPAA